MDEQFDQMRAFRDALIDFNERLRGSVEDLRRHHEAVSPIWQDQMRREYDIQWEPLDSAMKGYVEREGPGFVEFLSIKLHALERYLRGGGY
jgi:uncharacterized protein YukE